MSEQRRGLKLEAFRSWFEMSQVLCSSNNLVMYNKYGFAFLALDEGSLSCWVIYSISKRELCYKHYYEYDSLIQY